MRKPFFTGVCTALVTPFLDRNVNYPMAEQLLRRQLDAGVKAVVLSGTTGESPTLTNYEKLTLFQRCKSYVGKDCTIIAGTGSNSTAHAIELSKAAEDMGVDGLLVVSPYYNKGTADGLYSHYLSIAKSVSIPVIIYNVPSRTGVDIPVSVYKRLASISNIVGVKEASADITKIAKIRRECGDDFSIWSGNDDQIVPVTAMGGSGIISVLSNICPAETCALANFALCGDFKKAAALQCQLSPLIELLFSEVNPVPVKAALKLIGYDCGDCRLPLGSLSPETQSRLQEYFA